MALLKRIRLAHAPMAALFLLLIFGIAEESKVQPLEHSGTYADADCGACHGPTLPVDSVINWDFPDEFVISDFIVSDTITVQLKNSSFVCWGYSVSVTGVQPAYTYYQGGFVPLESGVTVDPDCLSDDSFLVVTDLVRDLLLPDSGLTSQFNWCSPWNRSRGLYVTLTVVGADGDNSAAGDTTFTIVKPVCEIYEPMCFVPGDANNSGAVTIGDVTFLIAYIFSGGSPPAIWSQGDADGSDRITIGDATYLISRIFSGGPAPICAGAYSCPE